MVLLALTVDKSGESFPMGQVLLPLHISLPLGPVFYHTVVAAFPR